MITRVKDYWTQVNERERMMLVVAGCFCLFYFIYALIYSPLTSAVNKSKLQLIENTSTLNWMNEVHRQYKSSTSLQTVTNSQFLSILGAQLHKTSFNTYAYKLEQASSGDLVLSFDAVPYNPFMLWLLALSKQYTFSIKQLNIDSTDYLGVVKIMVMLSISNPKT